MPPLLGQSVKQQQGLEPVSHFLRQLSLFTAVCMDPSLSNCTTHVVTVTINGDDAGNVKPKPKPGKDVVNIFKLVKWH